MEVHRLNRKSVKVGILITTALAVNLAGMLLLRQAGRDHALIAAIEQQDTGNAIRLLGEGADANAVNRGPLEHVMFTLDAQMPKQGPQTDSQEPEPLPALGVLYIADARRRIPPENTAIMQSLLAHGARPSFARTTILHLAARSNHVNSVKMLLARGMNPNIRDSFGCTPLTNASAAVALELIVRGADVNTKSKEGYTPLMDAASQNDPAKIKLLLMHGADINAVSGYGQSALYFAVMHSMQDHPEPQTVHFLLDHGARVDLKDGGGKTALDFAMGYKDSTFGPERTHIVEMLESAYKKERAAK